MPEINKDATNKGPRFLITRLSHIGDCVLTLPLVNHIKSQLPDSNITWAVQSPSNQLLSLHPAVDELSQIPKGWMGRPKIWMPLRAQLRAGRFDAVIDPQGITKSATLGWISGCKKRIGIRGRWGRELSPWLNNVMVETHEDHLVDRSLELLSGIGLGVSNVCPEFNLPVCHLAMSKVQTWIKNGDLPSGAMVMLNPGGSWASKRWEMDRYAEVACHLKQTYGVTSVIVWAGEQEYQMAETIHQDARDATVIAPPTSLKELAALATQVKFFIGGDTGPMHLAAAMGTPCVGLYGTTRPQDSGAYGDQHVALQSWYQSGSCRERRTANNDAMRDIQVSDVNAACESMLDKLGVTKPAQSALQPGSAA